MAVSFAGSLYSAPLTGAAFLADTKISRTYVAPEPASASLLATGLLGLIGAGAVARRRRDRA